MMATGLSKEGESVDNKKLVTSKELSEKISVPVWSIQKLTREKRIPAYSLNGRTFLYDPEEVVNYIKKKKIS